MLRLDINLVFTMINLLVLYLLMKRFLFKPVNNIIAQREEAIKKQFEDAEESKKKAAQIQQQYEEALANAKEDSAKLVQEAKEKAKTEYERIVKSADSEVTRKMQKAEETIAEEKARSLRSIETEIENLVVVAASKVVGNKVSAENSQKLYDDFLTEMGEKQ